MNDVEKKKPQYSLDDIKATFCTKHKLNITATAQLCALRLGIDRDKIVTIVQGMQRSQFYKSMTSEHDTTIWQDVYHVPYASLTLYVKFTVDARGYLLISFKEK